MFVFIIIDGLMDTCVYRKKSKSGKKNVRTSYTNYGITNIGIRFQFFILIFFSVKTLNEKKLERL